MSDLPQRLFSHRHKNFTVVWDDWGRVRDHGAPGRPFSEHSTRPTRRGKEGFSFLSFFLCVKLRKNMFFSSFLNRRAQGCCVCSLVTTRFYFIQVEYADVFRCPAWMTIVECPRYTSWSKILVLFQIAPLTAAVWTSYQLWENDCKIQIAVRARLYRRELKLTSPATLPLAAANQSAGWCSREITCATRQFCAKISSDVHAWSCRSQGHVRACRLSELRANSAKLGKP